MNLFSNSRNFYLQQIFTFLVSMIIFGVYLISVQRTGLLFNSFHEGSDMLAYIHNALQGLEGNWPGKEPFYRAPGYSFFLTICLKLFNNFYPVFYLQAILYSLTILMISHIAKINWSQKVSILLVVLLLLYSSGWYWIAILHSTTLEIFLVTLHVYTIAIWIQKLKEKQGRIYLWSFFTGIVYATLCLTRPNFILLAPIYVVVTPFIYKKYRKTLFICLALIIVGWTICSVPIFWHNTKVTQKLSLYSTNGKMTYICANSLDSPIYNFVYPKERQLKITESIYWEKTAKRFIAFWKSWEYPQNISYQTFKEYSPLLKVFSLPAGGIIGLFFYALIFAPKQINKNWFIWAVFLVYYVTLSFFFVIGRFRAPAMPLLVLLAAPGLIQLKQLLNETKKKKLVLHLLAVAIFIAITIPWQTYQNKVFVRNLAWSTMHMGANDLALKYWQDYPDLHEDYHALKDYFILLKLVGDESIYKQALGKQKVFSNEDIEQFSKVYEQQMILWRNSFGSRYWPGK